MDLTRVSIITLQIRLLFKSLVERTREPSIIRPKWQLDKLENNSLAQVVLWLYRERDKLTASCQTTNPMNFTQTFLK